jgi:hypothetical protein
MHSKEMIEQVWRCTWNTVIVRTFDAVGMTIWRFTWRVGPSEVGDSLGCRDWGNLEMQSEIVIEQDCWCTCRLLSSEIWTILGGGQSRGCSSAGRRHRSWHCIHWLTCNCGNVENGVQHGLPRDGRLAGRGRQLVLGWCSTQCMQYSLNAALGGCCT